MSFNNLECFQYGLPIALSYLILNITVKNMHFAMKQSMLRINFIF